MTVPNISCPSCGFAMQPVWYQEKNSMFMVSPQGEHTKRAVVCSVIRADIKKQ